MMTAIRITMSLVAWLGVFPIGYVGAQDDFTAPAIELAWRNGDKIAGTLQALNGEQVSVDSRFFHDRLHVGCEQIQALNFVDGPSAIPKASHLMKLANGSRIFGRLVEVDSTSVTFETPWWGVSVWEREEVLQIESLSRRLFEWSGRLEALGTTSGAPLQGWQVDSQGRLVSRQADSQAWLPMAFEQSFHLEVRLKSQGVPNFMIAIGESVETSLRLGTIDRHLVLGTGDDFEIVKTLADGERSLHYWLEWNAPEKRLNLFDAQRQKVASTSETVASEKKGVLLGNQGGSLEIENLLINAGEFLSSGEEGVVEGTGDRQDLVPASTHRGYSLRWYDGSTLWASEVASERGALRMVVPGMRSPSSIPCDGLQTLRFLEGKVDALREGPTFRLGSYTMHGKLEFAPDGRTLKWQPTGSEAAVGINLQIASLLTWPSSSQAREREEGMDQLHFKNGDQVPCRVLAMDERGVQVESSFIRQGETGEQGVRWVPNVTLRAMEFQQDGQTSKHAFTKESREQLLTLPRDTECSLYPHAILARNGDLLRGNILRLDRETLEAESKLEPLLLARSRLQGIVFLEGAVDKPVPTPPSPEASPAAIQEMTQETTMEEFRVLVSQRFPLTGRLVHADGTYLTLESQALGVCRVAWESVTALGIGGIEVRGSLPIYADWALRKSLSPRWKEADSSSTNSQELVGTRIEDFELPGIDGSTFRLAEQAGKVVVLDFWASWCAPCVKLMPEYMQVVQEFSSNDVVFLGVNGSETPEAIRRYLGGQDWGRFSTLLDLEGQLGAKLQVQGIPHTVVIAPDGVIRYVHVGYSTNAASELRQCIQSLLGSR